MKSLKKVFWAIILVPLMAGSKGVAQEQDLGSPTDGPWMFSTRVGGEFSDNRDGTENDKESNFDFIIEPRADYRFRDGDRTVLDLAALPMLKWHSNPRDNSQGSGQNDTELFGTAIAELSHQLTPRLLLSIGDAITYNDDPSISSEGSNVRYSNNHIWNNAHANVDYVMTEQLTGGIGGNYALKRYSDSVVADTEDEDIFEGSANLKRTMGSGYKLIGTLGASKFKNSSVDQQRGSTVLGAGAGVEKTFTPDLIGKVMAGYQHGEYENDALDSIDTPNGSAELTMRAASATRFRVGGSYGFYAPYVRPYSIQTLTAINAGVDHDVLSKRLTVSLNGQYGNGHYKSEGDLEGGDDTMVMVGVRADYRLNRNWSLNGGYTLENWDSDVRESFTRNLVDFGVKAQL
ncbi:MAG: outer membrane beta-barrel protein [bacterium]|jgi:hypothetical protein